MAKIFGHNVDLKSVAQIVAVVAGVFSLNGMEQREITNYVKLKNMEWAEKQTHDAEIERMLRDKVTEIK